MSLWRCHYSVYSGVEFKRETQPGFAPSLLKASSSPLSTVPTQLIQPDVELRNSYIPAVECAVELSGFYSI